jgi:hypothetical protein
MKLYEIKNGDYETKKVAAENMEEALVKYRKHLQEHINPDYSYMAIFDQITSCNYISEYQEDNIIV